MSVTVYRDWHHQAVEYVRWSLASSRPLATAVHDSIDLASCAFTAFVPDGGAVAAFETGVGQPVSDCVERMADVILDCLAAPFSAVVFEHHLLDAREPQTYLAPPLRVAGDTVYQLASTGESRARVIRQIRDWNVLPIFNAFVATFDDPAAEGAALGGDGGELSIPLVARATRSIICGAYDEEGFVWTEIRGATR